MDSNAPRHDTPLGRPTYVLRFTQTFETALEAGRSFGARMLRWYYLGFGAALVAGFLIALLMPTLRFVGVLLAIFSGFMLFIARFAVLDRIVGRWQARSLLDQPVQLTLGDDGLLWEGPHATSLVPWSSMTEVRATDRVVLFIRDRMLLAYAPAEAFATPEARAEVVAYSRSRITEAKRAGLANDEATVR